MKHIHGVSLRLLLWTLLFSCGSPYGKMEGKWMGGDNNSITFEIRIIDDTPVLETKAGKVFPILIDKKPMKVIVSGSDNTWDFIYDSKYDLVYINGNKYTRTTW